MKLLRLKRIVPCIFYQGRVKAKRQRNFNRHAKRWQHGMKAKQPGELLQIDHMSIDMGSKIEKEFKRVVL